MSHDSDTSKFPYFYLYYAHEKRIVCPGADQATYLNATKIIKYTYTRIASKYIEGDLPNNIIIIGTAFD